MSLFLDECVTVKEPTTRLPIERCKDVLGEATDDFFVKEYAKVMGQTLVTKDLKLVYRCLAENVDTAIYRDGKAYVVKVVNVIDLIDDWFVAP